MDKKKQSKKYEGRSTKYGEFCEEAGASYCATEREAPGTADIALQKRTIAHAN
jgi:hypothetical protein